MTKHLLWIALLCLLACQSPPRTESTRPLTQEEKVDDFQECLGDGCARVKLVYPVFEGDTALAGTLNRQVTEQNLHMWGNGDRQYGSMEEAVASFLESFRNFRKSFPEAPQEWTFETVAKVTHQSDSLVS